MFDTFFVLNPTGMFAEIDWMALPKEFHQLTLIRTNLEFLGFYTTVSSRVLGSTTAWGRPPKPSSELVKAKVEHDSAPRAKRQKGAESCSVQDGVRPTSWQREDTDPK